MRAAVRSARARLGRRRGIALLILGVGQISWGIGFITAPGYSTQGLELLQTLCPVHRWAWLWIAGGAVTAVAAFLRVGRDTTGFLAALAAPFVWSVSYGSAAVTGVYPRGAFILAWYMTTHVGMILWAATVPEYEVPPAVRKGPA